MREIASKYFTNHRRVQRVLIRNNIPIRPRTRKPPSRKHPSARVARYANMMHHLWFDVELEWILQFDDFEKLSFVNKQISNRDGRFTESQEWYMAYIQKFYNDPTFNFLYINYKEAGCDKYLKPSLDHIVPRSKGGTNDLDNLRFVTYLENMCRRDIPMEKWDEIKANLEKYFV